MGKDIESVFSYIYPISLLNRAKIKIMEIGLVWSEKEVDQVY